MDRFQKDGHELSWKKISKEHYAMLFAVLCLTCTITMLGQSVTAQKRFQHPGILVSEKQLRFHQKKSKWKDKVDPIYSAFVKAQK